jgi:diacylglycerol kinase (ATP)
MLLRFLRLRARSFGYAFEGWWHVIRTQRNAWIHALASLLAFLFSIWLQISPVELALLVVVIALVWLSEFFNTALEALVDLASPGVHPLAKVAKDVAAAAVLIAALASVIVGILILGPPLADKLAALVR